VTLYEEFLPNDLYDYPYNFLLMYCLPTMATSGLENQSENQEREKNLDQVKSTMSISLFYKIMCSGTQHGNEEYCKTIQDKNLGMPMLLTFGLAIW
jgi:hypothetical protein